VVGEWWPEAIAAGDLAEPALWCLARKARTAALESIGLRKHFDLVSLTQPVK
jgi:succinylarginine dihydrolase